MKRDSRLSGVLHVLIHMLRTGPDVPTTSEKLAVLMGTNPVVIRRLFSGLRESGLISSEKGHGGGWRIACNPARVTLAEIYRAVGSPAILALGHRTESPGCLVEQAVNAALEPAFCSAQAILLARLGEITLAELANEVNRRWDSRANQKRQKHAV